MADMGSPGPEREPATGSRAGAPGGSHEPTDQVGKVHLFSSLVAAITSRSSFGPGTAGLEAKISHWFLILSAGSAVTAYISCISWWSEPRKYPCRVFSRSNLAPFSKCSMIFGDSAD